MTPQQLIDYGQCFLCIPGVSLADTIELSLLSQISFSQGTASGNIDGSGSPVGVVTPTAKNQQYRDNDTDNYYWATGLTSADWQLYL